MRMMTLAGASTVRAGLTAVVLVSFVFGCDRQGGCPHRKYEPVAQGNWTPERIAQDPEGFLVQADKDLVNQIQNRETTQVRLKTRKNELEPRYAVLSRKLADVENLNKRFAAAIQKADDEDQWPIKVAGKSFDKEKAKAVVESTRRYIDDHQALVATYREAQGKIDGMLVQLSQDLVNLKRVKEKVGIDLERVRLNKGIAELGDLKKTEAEIASVSKALTEISDDAVGRLQVPDAAATTIVDVEDLLK